MHNPLAEVADALYRRLSYAYVQSLAMSMLVFPVYLSHEHNAMEAISSLDDPRVLVILVVWSAVGGLLYLAFSKRYSGDRMNDAVALGVGSSSQQGFAATRQARIGVGIILTIVPYIPASHVRNLRT